MVARLPYLLFFALMPAFTVNPHVQAGESGSWLNVQDCGVSGSDFETTASTTAGSKQITVSSAGDLKAGQSIIVAKCNIHYPGAELWDGMYSRKPVEGAVDLRGYDGSGGGWKTFLIDVDGTAPASFRWSEDIGQSWKARRVPITSDWQSLSAGVELRFGKREWKPGNVITFHARDQLFTTIEKIEGNVLTVQDAPNRTVADAIVRHEDTAALQTAIGRAIKEKRNLYLPSGRYRILRTLTVQDAAGIIIEGDNGVNTVLDISHGEGPCLHLVRGTEVTIRNMKMIGHSGLAEKAGYIRTSGGYDIWGMNIKPCGAVNIARTERVLVENVHASRMANEAFYAQAPARWGKYEPPQYTKSITYLRCSVTDCGFNAFNNNDLSESTSVLYCRAENIGNCFWEGPGRFIRLVGNYVRNSGVMAVGNMFHRYPELYDIGCAQTIVADNVFEGPAIHPWAILVSYGASQVVIRSNLFINYPATAIQVSSAAPQGFPPQNVTVTDNVIDLTSEAAVTRNRTGIITSAGDTLISGNQVYVRGQCDPKVTGISVSEPALNVDVHDNLIRNCGSGLITGRVQDGVSEVVDATTFLCAGGVMPMERRTSHLYRGWTLVWINQNKPSGFSVIDAFDPESLRFRLKEPRDMKVGDRFEVFPPYGANWNIHSNTIAGCLNPVVLDSYGSESSVLKDNIITRGDATGIAKAVVMNGRFDLVGNQVCGFDEPGTFALVLQPDRIGRILRNVYRDNVFQRCALVMEEGSKALWESAIKDGNQFINCGTELKAALPRPQIAPGKLAATGKPVFHAPRLTKPVTVDGDLKEWPRNDRKRVVVLETGPMGEAVASPKAWACAGWMENHLYLALRVAIPRDAKIVPGLNWQGDGVEVSFRGGDPKNRTPIYMLWGTTDGTFNSTTQGGASAEQVGLLEKATGYAARVEKDTWTCEWRIPMTDLGLKPATTKVLLFNLGVRSTAEGNWIAWVPTGSAIYMVDSAGALRIDR